MDLQQQCTGWHLCSCLCQLSIWTILPHSCLHTVSCSRHLHLDRKLLENYQSYKDGRELLKTRNIIWSIRLQRILFIRVWLGDGCVAANIEQLSPSWSGGAWRADWCNLSCAHTDDHDGEIVSSTLNNLGMIAVSVPMSWVSAGPGQSLFILSVLMSRLSSAVDTSPSLVTHNGDEEEFWKNLQSFLTIFLLKSFVSI